jgi:hypothetical protein
MSVIADLGDYGPAFAVFWFDAGIVLYTDPHEARDDSITLYSPDGQVHQQWQLAGQTLAHENPVRYKGHDYLAFPQWNLYDVATGHLMYVPGTLAVVSAANPDESLVLQACNNREALEPTWDVYSFDGFSLGKLSDISRPTLSPDGTELAFISYANNNAVMINDGVGVRQVGEIPFPADSVLWGATIYTITPIGEADCGRAAQG